PRGIVLSLVLGFNAYIHDTAAALVADGALVALAEEERFIRQKHTTAFPENGIACVLSEAGAAVRDLSTVAFYWDPQPGFARRVGQTIARLPGSLRQLARVQLGNWRSMRNVEATFRARYGFTGSFRHVNHYLAHAAGAYYPSPFERAAILVVDGNGEIATTWLGIGEGGKIRRLREVFYPHSLGLFYCTITEYLGFRQNCDEGKVMGLSAYGSSKFVARMREIVRVADDGTFRLDLSYFDYHRARRNWHAQKFVEAFGPPREPGSPIDDRHRDVAFAAQAVLEESVLAIARALVRETGCRHLAYSGGVALNCVANDRLLRDGVVDALFVPPPAYDAGASWGAALAVHHENPAAPRHAQRSPYAGPAYSDADCEVALKSANVPYTRPDDLAGAIAEALAAGRIVARFAGRAEMGPRALGHRSILADPRPSTMKDHLNARVKHREAFRPFGPSVLAERAGDLFDMRAPDAPYMLLAVPVRGEWRARIPAVTHVDGTARIQTVTREDDPDYHAIIAAFAARTDVPCVVNTSFNVMGEPIVNTPADAVACFVSTGIDDLALGPFFAVKSS
ncbi:hypothetical protein K8I61_09770, partial [bacterium]|nr:hypothetical protein [bacterium]